MIDNDKNKIYSEERLHLNDDITFKSTIFKDGTFSITGIEKMPIKLAPDVKECISALIQRVDNRGKHSFSNAKEYPRCCSSNRKEK